MFTDVPFLLYAFDNCETEEDSLELLLNEKSNMQMGMQDHVQMLRPVFLAGSDRS